MDIKIKKFTKIKDERGSLIVFLQNNDLATNDKEFGQIYFVTFDKLGVIRGNHYHKRWREWFGVVSGAVEAHLIDIETNEEKTMILDSSGDEYILLEIGPKIAHAFKNITPNAQLLNYANGEWSESDSIKYEVIKNE